MYGTRKRILVVDDDDDILEVTKTVLEQMGHHEVAICDKTRLIERLQKSVPDLILLEYGLNDTTAKRICKRLKDNENTKNLPIIIFSTDVNIERVCNSIGADDYISKPYDVNHLLEKVNKLVD